MPGLKEGEVRGTMKEKTEEAEYQRRDKVGNKEKAK